ncbi:MAG: hypothetical protein JNK15_01295 [Planctomycetes bacterium]|nr:hypothetical protein [Planctomycetota bacterium]
MRPFASVVLVAVAVLAARSVGEHGADFAVSSPVAPAVADTLAAVQFVENRGQWDPAVRFAALGDTAGWLLDDGFTLRFERWAPAATGDRSGPSRIARDVCGAVVRTRFLDAQTPTWSTGPELAARRNFLVGERSRWRDSVPAFGTVTMGEVLPGVAVVFRPLPDGRRGPFEYDLMLQPGADLAGFRARVDGVDRLRLGRDGRLHAEFAIDGTTHELVQEPPIAWQETPAGSRPLAVAFRLFDDHTYGFVADGLDPSFAAVVDPGVVWGTFLGGGLTDSVNAMRWRDGLGVWVGGWASSTDFPTTLGAFRTTGQNDGFVARLSDTGTALQFATYLGGAGNEEVRGLDLGPGDVPVVVGYTASANFPVTPGARQPSYAGGSLFFDVGDGFVTRLAANGGSLLASTYLGGVFDDVAEAVVAESSGAVAVAGWSSSHDFPTTAGAFQPALSGIPGFQSDGFFLRLDAAAQTVLASTFCGGTLNEQFVALDRMPATGDYVVAGWTVGNDFPVTPNVVRPISSGFVDGVVTRFPATATSAAFSTYLGGLQNDYALALRVASDNSIWVGGATFSPNWPTSPGAPQTVWAGVTDGFVTQLAANGQSIGFSTLVGGPAGDKVRALDVGPQGVFVVGEAGPGFPVTANALQPTFGGGNLDAFCTHYTNGGSTLSWSTYLGGANQESFGSCALGTSGLAVVGGWSFSADFPIAPAGLQGVLHGVEDGVVMKFDLIASFGDTLVVGPDPQPAVVTVEAGERELLRTRLTNQSPRDLAIDAVDLLVAGAGPAPMHLGDVRVFCDVGTPPVSTLVAGPFAVVGDDRELAVALTGCVVPASGTATLRVVGTLAANPSGFTAEVAVAIVDADAWTIRAVGAGSGPLVRVVGSGRAVGDRLVLGALPGDSDRDGAVTVVDVRRQLVTLGSSDRAADTNGDGSVDMSDVFFTRGAVLGRAAVMTGAGLAHRGEWFTLGGVFPGDTLQASLGGRALTLGQVTPREATLRVPDDQAVGTQELVVTLAGRVVLQVLVGVQ